MARLVAGFLLAPLVAFPVTALSFWLRWISQADVPSLPLRSLLGALASYGLVALVWAYGTMVLVGIPVALFLRRVGQFRPAVMATAGVLAGALYFVPSLVSSVIQAVQSENPIIDGSLPYSLTYTLTGALTGAAAALVVWRFGRHPPAKLDVR